LTHQYSGAGAGSTLTAPVAALVEKIGLVQVTEAAAVLLVVLAGTVVAFVVAGATLVVGATVVAVDGTFVVVGDGVTGTAAAGASPTGGVVVVEEPTW
jgi:hypothetical protein